MSHGDNLILIISNQVAMDKRIDIFQQAIQDMQSCYQELQESISKFNLAKERRA